MSVPLAVAPPGHRSVVLVAWVRCWRAGLVSYDQAVDAIQAGDDHLVDARAADLARDPAADPDDPLGNRLAAPSVDGAAETVVPLAIGLAAFSRLAPEAVRAVLPAPGDPRGLPGPGAFTSAALVAGEGATCAEVGLVPEVTEFGPGVSEAFTVVRWRAYRLRPAPGEQVALAEADGDLTVALHAATDLLRRLDVARTSPELASAVAALRRGDGPVLPRGYGARARSLLARATTVAEIVRLAGADAPGRAVDQAEAAEREAALRPLATAARRARAAAVNAPLDQP